MRIFDLDSPIMRFLSIVADVMIIGLLWMVTNGIGVYLVLYGLAVNLALTVLGALWLLASVGSSTTGAYFVLTRRVSNREGYLLKDYFIAMKTNFKTATLVFLVIGPIILLTALNIFVPEMLTGVYGGFATVAFVLNFLVLIESLFVFIHVFPMLSRFSMGFKQLLKSAFLIANKHLFTTLTHAALFAGIILFSLYVAPPLLFFAAGIYFWLSSHLLMRIYRKYRPEMDRNEEELEQIEQQQAEQKRQDELKKRKRQK